MKKNDVMMSILMLSLFRAHRRSQPYRHGLTHPTPPCFPHRHKNSLVPVPLDPFNFNPAELHLLSEMVPNVCVGESTDADSVGFGLGEDTGGIGLRLGLDLEGFGGGARVGDGRICACPGLSLARR